MRGKTNKSRIFSNPNLLINPFFTLNSRGQSGYTTANTTIYTIDRWRIGWQQSLIINSDGSLTLSTLSDDTSLWFEQPTESTLRSYLLGKTVTFSVKLSDDTIHKSTFVFNNGSYFFEDKNYKINIALDDYGIRLTASAPASMTVKACKLELGEISTLHLDPPPNYVEELLKCQREFVRLTNRNLGYQSFATGVGNGVNQAVFNIHTPVPMRITPTISFSNLRIVGKGCDYVPVKSIQATDVVGSSVTALVTVDSPSTISNGEVYQISGNDVGVIDLSAEL